MNAPIDKIEGIDEDSMLSKYNASDYGERASCRHCSSPVWWRVIGKPVPVVAAGLLDDQTGLSVQSEIFVDRRCPWMKAHEGASQTIEAESM